MAASQGQYRRFLGRAIDVEGENGGFAAVERATSDLRSAIDGADVIIVVTGGNAQAVVGAIACASAPERSGDPC